MSARYVRRKIREASERARRRANSRWRLDRERRERLAAMEMERRKRFVVILQNTETGESRMLPWNEKTLWRLRALVEAEKDL